MHATTIIGYTTDEGEAFHPECLTWHRPLTGNPDTDAQPFFYSPDLEGETCDHCGDLFLDD